MRRGLAWGGRALRSGLGRRLFPLREAVINSPPRGFPLRCGRAAVEGGAVASGHPIFLPGGCLAHPARGFSRRAVQARGGGGAVATSCLGQQACPVPLAVGQLGDLCGTGGGREQPAMMLQPSLLGPLSAASCVSLSSFPPEHVGCGLPFLSSEILFFSYTKSHNFRKEARSIFVSEVIS